MIHLVFLHYPVIKAPPPVTDSKQWEKYGARPKTPTRSQSSRNQRNINYHRAAAPATSDQQFNKTVVNRPLPQPPPPPTTSVTYENENEACNPPYVKNVCKHHRSKINRRESRKKNN